MASLNVAMIRDRARSILGRDISDQEAVQIMNATGGGDEGQVLSYLQRTKDLQAPSSQGTTADQIIQTSIDKYTQLTDQYNSKLREFDTNNPFVFDDILAEETAKTTQRLDPYYTQTLSDFMRGVETKRTRSLDDQRTLLTELQQDTDSYTGDAKIALDAALTRSREGFADAGLYGSGAQMREEGAATAASQRGTDRFIQGQEESARRAKLGTGRALEDLGFQETTGRRDIEAERQYQTTSQSLSESLRRQSQREFERQQYAGTPPGVDPQQFQTFAYGLLG